MSRAKINALLHTPRVFQTLGFFRAKLSTTRVLSAHLVTALELKIGGRSESQTNKNSDNEYNHHESRRS